MAIICRILIRICRLSGGFPALEGARRYVERS